MDDIKKNLNNISLYDVKAYVRKAQNVVYNYTDMEAKVREATNNEPWGASSTLMQKIAAGTYNYREREEIIGMIFRRFTEKASNEWRQIYKALQLLDYLLKNGSERFVDDARANLSLITMLRSFHYIDSQGRDQGINVRTKAKTLVEILNNDSQLRSERKKSRENSKKFLGVAGGGASTIPGASADEFGTYEGRIFGDGGVYGERYEETRAASRSNNDFEEYDENIIPKASNVKRNSSRNYGARAAARKASLNKPVPKPAPKKEVDLFSFDDEPTPSSSQQTNGNTSTAASSAPANDDDDDDFGDFQGSTVQQSTQQQQPSLTNNLANLYQSQPQPAAAPINDGFGDFASFTSNTQAQQPQQANYNTSISTGPAQAPKNDAFSSLFQAASSTAHTGKPSTPSLSAKPSYSAQQSQPQQTQSQPTVPPKQSNGDELNLLDL
ncbi:Epsin-1 [Wickerhamomyces ciferrii]|uniref:Epsin-1 n=1 Tax=Wickerhamomyces ciferrii (strain ATCC 14091 / BCRC 22168 / CBS 111 / JCM 3599 / NBRC 0793 / NRRL Y-1031 F-60-10) TaxID=1206466 RepID=K0KY34_WICCF|nr:Epsin-1 [Wickerhamomyces ciferrii]CCH46987.1 Epsin-1 [Wickerhamomyces ciferrii]